MCVVGDNPSRPPVPGLCEIAPGRWGPPQIPLVCGGGSRHRGCEVTGGGHSDERPHGPPGGTRCAAVIDPPGSEWGVLAPHRPADPRRPRASAAVPTATVTAVTVATAAAAAAIAAAAAALQTRTCRSLLPSWRSRSRLRAG